MSCKSGANTWKIVAVYWYSRRSHKLFETDQKFKVAKQATSKTSFLPYQAQSWVLWWQPSYQKTMGIMIWMTKSHFSTFNRLNFHFQSIHSISPVIYSCGQCTWYMLTIPGIIKVKWPIIDLWWGGALSYSASSEVDRQDNDSWLDTTHRAGYKFVSFAIARLFFLPKPIVSCLTFQ